MFYVFWVNSVCFRGFGGPDADLDKASKLLYERISSLENWNRVWMNIHLSYFNHELGKKVQIKRQVGDPEEARGPQETPK